jgi:type IV pilus assembly protein PilF
MRLAFVLLPLALAACISPKRMAQAEAKVGLGAAYFREGNVESAIGELREAARLDPRSWRPWNTLGILYIAKGEQALAEEAFDRALRLAPEEAEVLNNYGTLLVDLGRNDEAVTAFQSALKDLDYRSPAIVYSNLAFALHQVGRPEEALRYAREATRRAPSLCRAWYNLGLIQEARQDALAALEAYREAQLACPDDATPAAIRTGCLQVAIGMPDGAEILQGIALRNPGTNWADEARTCLQASVR